MSNLSRILETFIKFEETLMTCSRQRFYLRFYVFMPFNGGIQMYLIHLWLPLDALILGLKNPAQTWGIKHSVKIKLRMTLDDLLHQVRSSQSS